MARPARSKVRDQLAEILYIAGKLTAYDAHKHFLAIFGKATQRNIYYQLRRGVEIGIFRVEDVVDEKGDYSWGSVSRKVYYELAPAASPQLNTQVKHYFDSIEV